MNNLCKVYILYQDFPMYLNSAYLTDPMGMKFPTPVTIQHAYFDT